MNKTWVVVVLIILVALVAYNFNGMTGKAVGDVTTITVSPLAVSFAKQDTMKLLQINVKPGRDGVDTKLGLYRDMGTYEKRVGSETINICTDSVCYDEVTVEYKLSRGLEPGKYFFRGERDKYNVKFDSNLFEITSVAKEESTL